MTLNELISLITVNNVANGQGCPCCYGRKVHIGNCLLIMSPQLSKEWHPTKNGDLKPNQISFGSHKKVWWICNKGHEWKTTPNSRMKEYGCPYCTNQKVCIDNCLATTHPHLIHEWHSDNIVTPYEVIAGASKKYKWICIKGHTWVISPVVRTSKETTGCPVCNESKGEKIIRNVLYTKNVKFSQQYKFDNCRYKNPLLFDFVVFGNELKLIEYNGIHHYEPTKFAKSINALEKFKLQIEKDNIKQRYCENNQIPLLIIPYWKKDNIEELITIFLEINNE